MFIGDINITTRPVNTENLIPQQTENEPRRSSRRITPTKSITSKQSVSQYFKDDFTDVFKSNDVQASPRMVTRSHSPIILKNNYIRIIREPNTVT